MRLNSFFGVDHGPWRVVAARTLCGAPLPTVAAVARSIVGGGTPSWSLHGIATEDRYLRPAERLRLAQRQESLGRPAARHAALIPIRKSPAWWALAQSERREILGERSRHVSIGLEYLPAVARQLLRCRDLDESAPFDFLTWFEYAPAHAPAFDELLARLRETPEWAYVDREVELRLATGAD